MAVFRFTFRDGETIDATLIQTYVDTGTHEVFYHVRDENGEEWEISDIVEKKIIENDPHYLAQEITVLKTGGDGGPGGMGL